MVFDHLGKDAVFVYQILSTKHPSIRRTGGNNRLRNGRYFLLYCVYRIVLGVYIVIDLGIRTLAADLNAALGRVETKAQNSRPAFRVEHRRPPPQLPRLLGAVGTGRLAGHKAHLVAAAVVLHRVADGYLLAPQGDGP